MTGQLKKLDDLCIWKLAKHTDKDTGLLSRDYKPCITCHGYATYRDCYISHKSMDEYLIQTEQTKKNKV